MNLFDAFGIVCLAIAGIADALRRKWAWSAVALFGIAVFALDMAGIGGPHL